MAMTGAESVLRTLAASGVDTCFANPGTSEMHLVAALDRVPEVRPILALFEGVVSGAADGYGRMRAPRRSRCCTSGRASGTRSPTSTTPIRRARRW